MQLREAKGILDSMFSDTRQRLIQMERDGDVESVLDNKSADFARSELKRRIDEEITKDTLVDMFCLSMVRSMQQGFFQEKLKDGAIQMGEMIRDAIKGLDALEKQGEKPADSADGADDSTTPQL